MLAIVKWLTTRVGEFYVCKVVKRVVQLHNTEEK